MLNEKYYALKEIPKYKLFSFSKMFSILNEPKILKKLIKYKFISTIISSFQDYENIYLITSYYEGQSLNFFKEQKLTEKQIKFVSACIIQSLFYLRKKKIIHRDIMMKNIIMDKDKYFNIIDFSYSIDYFHRNIKKNNMITYNLVSPPEILKNAKYDYNSDYYRLGSIIYYLIFKIYPYTVKKKKNIIDLKINHDYNNYYSSSFIDFLNKLIISDYKKRIGFNSINELKNHPWFKGFDWIKLEKKELKSPFHFVKNDFEQSFCTKIKISKNRFLKYKMYSKRKYYKNLIKNFDYVNEIIIKKIKNSFNIK